MAPMTEGSSSLRQARRAPHLLAAAGVEFSVEPAAIDEARLKREMRASRRTAIDCALALAEQKRAAVSRRHPDALVIGADQILVAGEEWFDKPADLAEARAQLQACAAARHVLATAVCVVRARRARCGRRRAGRN